MQTILKAAPRTAADFYQTAVYTEVLRLVVDRTVYKHGLEDRNGALTKMLGPEPLEWWHPVPRL